MKKIINATANLTKPLLYIKDTNVVVMTEPHNFLALFTAHFSSRNENLDAKQKSSVSVGAGETLHSYYCNSYL